MCMEAYQIISSQKNTLPVLKRNSLWCEQRGAGLSFQGNRSYEGLTSEQLVSDIIALTNYLRERFGREKIYLMGRSGGTFIGIQAAAKAPQLYHAYIGMAQISNQLKSEQLAYHYMLAQFQGNAKMLKVLKASPINAVNGTPKSYLALRDKAMHSLGIGTMRSMRSVPRGLFLPSLFFRNTR